MPKPTDYLSATDAASYLKISRSTFYRLWNDGELADIAIYRPSPKRPLFHRGDLDKWLIARGGKPPTED